MRPLRSLFLAAIVLAALALPLTLAVTGDPLTLAVTGDPLTLVLGALIGAVVTAPRELLTSEQAADYLGISVRTLSQWRYLADGRGPAYRKVGRLVRYHVDDVASYLERGARSGGSSTDDEQRSQAV